MDRMTQKAQQNKPESRSIKRTVGGAAAAVGGASLIAGIGGVARRRRRQRQRKTLTARLHLRT
jgi:hypothetical protein